MDIHRDLLMDLNLGGEEWEMSRTSTINYNEDFGRNGDASPLSDNISGSKGVLSNGQTCNFERPKRSWENWTNDDEISFDPHYMDSLVEAGVVERSPLGETETTNSAPPPLGTPFINISSTSPDSFVKCSHVSLTSGSNSSASSTAPFTPDAEPDFLGKPCRASGKAKEEKRKIRRKKLKRALLKAKSSKNRSSTRVVVGKKGQVQCWNAKLVSSSTKPTDAKDLLALVASLRSELTEKNAMIKKLKLRLAEKEKSRRSSLEIDPKKEDSLEKVKDLPMFKETITKHQSHQKNELLLDARKKLRKIKSAMTPRQRVLAERSNNVRSLESGKACVPGALLLHSKMFLRRQFISRDENVYGSDSGWSPGSVGTPV